jgi:glycosyltransferase involved in cell wall biosynthesis
MKILLIPDHPGWAFDHRAKDLLSLPFKNIQFELKYLPVVKSEDQHNYDLLYPMSISIAKKLNMLGIPYNKMASALTSKRVFEKQLLKQESKIKFIKFLNSLRGINAWSDEIINIFKPDCQIYKTRIGINQHLFKPASNRKQNDKFTVGWVGNISKKQYRELKGYDIVLKALKNLDVKLEIRTFEENYVPRHEMVSFYQGIDCFICSSASEGLPNPVLEAAACGVPIITTNVGIVPELIKNRENGVIVERSAEAIKKEVKFLMEHREFCDKLGRNIAKTINKNWTWDVCKKDWEQYFLSLV